MMFEKSVGTALKIHHDRTIFKVMFMLDRKSESDKEINKGLIQRCVDKRLIDENRTRQSLDLEMMELARRIFEESKTTMTHKREV